MQRLLVITSLALGAACSPRLPMNTNDSFDTVTYFGEVITLPRRYSDFHDYRDDPHNLPATEHARVARLVRAAPIKSAFPTREEANDAVFKLMFPGYGLSMFQLKEPIALYSIEVPRTNEDRVLVFKQEQEQWLLVDDFVWPLASGTIRAASYVNGRLQYRGQDGQVLR
jgi:hypothetical protein